MPVDDARAARTSRSGWLRGDGERRRPV